VYKEDKVIGTNELIIGGLLVGAILLIVLAFVLRINRKAQKDVTFQSALPEDDPLVTRDEFQATPIAEAVEERVRQKVSENPDLAEMDVDFGSGPNGELEIWVNSERYTSIEEIPHDDLKALIREAVEAYNQGL
jgi:hypothetical protein